MLYSRTLLFTHPIYYSLPLLIWNTHSFLSFPVPPWQPQFFSLYLWICFCFIDMWICNDVNRPKDCHTKESKSETERQIPHDITYMWHLKYDANQHISKKVTFNLILEKCLGDHLAEKTEKKIPFGKRPKGQNSELWKEVVCLDTWGLWGGGLEDEAFKTGNLSLTNVGLLLGWSVSPWKILNQVIDTIRQNFRRNVDIRVEGVAVVLEKNDGSSVAGAAGRKWSISWSAFGWLSGQSCLSTSVSQSLTRGCWPELRELHRFHFLKPTTPFSYLF